MKVERYNALSLWGPRPESPEQCARRMQRMLEEWADIHELLARWYEKAWSRAAALEQRIDPSYESLVELFRASAEEPELGYSVGWWNGADDDRAMGVSAYAGAWSPYVFNIAKLDLPRVPERASHLFEPASLLAILSAMVRAWEPDYAELGSQAMRMTHYHPDDDHDWPAGKPRVGWFTYLSAHRLGGLPRELPCEMVELPGLGAIFVLTREHRMSVHRPEDMRAMCELLDVLERAGALVPMDRGQDAP